MTANRIARYNPTTGVWSALGSGTSLNVNALAVLPGGDVIVGGGFTTAGGVAASNIARYNPTTGAWSALGSGTNNTVYSLAVLPGGDLIVGGNFSTAGGVAAVRAVRYNPTTGLWTALGLGTNGAVNALAVLPGGDVIMGGTFTLAGGVAVSNIARYNPTSGAWSALGSGIDVFGSVLSLAVLPGGDVIVGGTFASAGGVAANRIVRYNPATGVWSALGSGTNNTVFALAVLPGGDAIVGGQFTTAGGVAATSNVARVNPTTGNWSALAGGSDGTVTALAVRSGGDVIVGGAFSAAGGAAASRIAQFRTEPLAPSIATQPLPVVTAASNSAVFYCGAIASVGSTGTLTYQWRKGGVAINTITNPSAATPVLMLSNVQVADLGSYTCFVSNTCGGTGTLSNPAALSFVTPPVGCGLSDVAGPGGAIGPDGELTADDIILFINRFTAGC